MHSLAIIGVRDRAVAVVGELPWKGVYAFVSIIGLVALVYGYGVARGTPTLLWAPPTWTRHLALLVMVPVFPLLAAAYVPGSPGHSWQAIASGGTTIGNKAMVVAAKTLTLAAIELFENPDIVAEAKAERERRAGADFVYESLVGDRPPPLDYRKPASQ